MQAAPLYLRVSRDRRAAHRPDRGPEEFSVIALTMHIPWMEQRRIVWLDGRPHPPEYAAHTWQGFSTGRWEGETLVVDTTHLKAGWIRRNGLALTDKATMREYFIRHGNTLTHTYVISDPYYLSEPMIKTSGFQLANNDNLAPYPCQAVEEVDRPRRRRPQLPAGEEPLPGRVRQALRPAAQGRAGGRRDGAARVRARHGHLGVDGGEAGTGRWPGRRAVAWRSWPRSRRGGQRAQPRRGRADTAEMKSLHVQGKIHMLVGAGANVLVSVGDDGVLVVDSGSRRHVGKAPGRDQQVGGRRAHPARDQHALPPGSHGRQRGDFQGRRRHRGRQLRAADQQPHRGRRHRLHLRAREHAAALRAGPAGQTALPVGAWPTDVFFGKKKDFSFNGEAVVLMFEPDAHTDGDILVHFRGSDVVAAGDAYINTVYPVDRPRQRRHGDQLPRRAQRAAGRHGAAGQAGSRHVRGARPRAAGRRGRRRRVSRHADDHSRPRRGAEESGHDAAAGGCGAAVARLRRTVRRGARPRFGRRVHRSAYAGGAGK